MGPSEEPAGSVSGTAAVLQNPAAQLSPPRPLALLPASQSPSVKLFEETGLTLAPRTQVGDFTSLFSEFPFGSICAESNL